VRRQSEAATALWINEIKAVSRYACHRTPKSFAHTLNWFDAYLCNLLNLRMKLIKDASSLPA
jgi:hypothetical protein